MNLKLPVIFNSPYVPIAGNFVDSLGLGIIVPFLPFFTSTFEDDVERANLWVGWILSAQFVGNFFGSYVMGLLSDKYGPKFALSLSLFGDIIFFLAGAFANSGISFLIFRFLAGFTSPATPADSWLVQASDEETRPKLIAYVLAATWGGFLIGGMYGNIHKETTFLSIIFKRWSQCNYRE